MQDVRQAEDHSQSSNPHATSAQSSPVGHLTTFSTSNRLEWLAFLLALLLVVGIGIYFRFQMLDSAAMGADSLSPYLKAVLVASGRRLLPQGPFPESGYIVAWTFLPYLLLANSLRQAFALRFAFNALIALPLMWGVWRLQKQTSIALVPRLLSVLVPGVIVALAPGLADTLLTGYQTFDAPLYASVACVSALVLLFRPFFSPSWQTRALWGLIPILPVLGMLHPLAIIYSLAALPLLVMWAIGLRTRPLQPGALPGPRLAGSPDAGPSGSDPSHERAEASKDTRGQVPSSAEAPTVTTSREWLVEVFRLLLPPLLAGLLLAAPHVWRHLSPALRGMSALSEHFWTIASAPGSFESLPAVLLKAAREEMLDREPLAHGIFLAAPLLGLFLSVWVGARAAVWPWSSVRDDASLWLQGFQRFSLWVLLLPLALIGMAAAVRYLQPYHLRLLYPAFALSLGLDVVLLQRLWAGNLNAHGEKSTLPPVTSERWRVWLQSIPPLLLLVVFSIQFIGHRYPPPPSGRESLREHMHLSARIRENALTTPDAKIVMSFVHLSQDLSGSPAAFMLDVWTSDWKESRFAHTPEALEKAVVYLTVTGKPRELAQARQVSQTVGALLLEDDAALGLLLLRLENAGQVRAWSQSLCAELAPDVPVRSGASNDYLSVLDLEFDTMIVPGWFSACRSPG